jgi:hypothetical protein
MDPRTLVDEFSARDLDVVLCEPKRIALDGELSRDKGVLRES